MIRRFNKIDLKRCNEIIKINLSNNFKDNINERNFFEEEFLDKLYFNNKESIFVFEEDGVIKGMGSADDNWIRKVFIDSSFEQEDIWNKIMDYLEKYIHSKGFDKIYLYSYQFTRNLCRKRGFIILEEKIFKRNNFMTKGFKMVKTII